MTKLENKQIRTKFRAKLFIPKGEK